VLARARDGVLVELEQALNNNASKTATPVDFEWESFNLINLYWPLESMLINFAPRLAVFAREYT